MFARCELRKSHGTLPGVKICCLCNVMKNMFEVKWQSGSMWIIGLWTLISPFFLPSSRLAAGGFGVEDGALGWASSYNTARVINFKCQADSCANRFTTLALLGTRENLCSVMPRLSPSRSGAHQASFLYWKVRITWDTVEIGVDLLSKYSSSRDGKVRMQISVCDTNSLRSSVWFSGCINMKIM